MCHNILCKQYSQSELPRPVKNQHDGMGQGWKRAAGSYAFSRVGLRVARNRGGRLLPNFKNKNKNKQTNKQNKTKQNKTKQKKKKKKKKKKKNGTCFRVGQFAALSSFRVGKIHLCRTRSVFRL